MLIPARKWRQTSKCSVLTRRFPPCQVPAKLRHCNTSIAATHSWWQPFPPTVFLFFRLSLKALFFALNTEIDCCTMYVFCTSTFVRSRSASIWYILSGAKLVTAYLVWKVGARFAATMGAKKISTIIPAQDVPSARSFADGSILLRKPCKLSVGTLVKHRKGYIKR